MRKFDLAVMKFDATKGWKEEHMPVFETAPKPQIWLHLSTARSVRGSSEESFAAAVLPSSISFRAGEHQYSAEPRGYFCEAHQLLRRAPKERFQHVRRYLRGHVPGGSDGCDRCVNIVAWTVVASFLCHCRHRCAVTCRK